MKEQKQQRKEKKTSPDIKTNSFSRKGQLLSLAKENKNREGGRGEEKAKKRRYLFERRRFRKFHDHFGLLGQNDNQPLKNPSTDFYFLFLSKKKKR